MTEPITQSALERRILEAVDLLELATDRYAEVVSQASQAEADHKVRRAVAYRSAEGTVGERDALADQKTADELARRLNTEAVAKAAKEALESRRSVLSALQSLLRTVSDQTKPL